MEWRIKQMIPAPTGLKAVYAGEDGEPFYDDVQFVLLQENDTGQTRVVGLSLLGADGKTYPEALPYFLGYSDRSPAQIRKEWFGAAVLHLEKEKKLSNRTKPANSTQLPQVVP